MTVLSNNPQNIHKNPLEPTNSPSSNNHGCPNPLESNSSSNPYGKKNTEAHHPNRVCLRVHRRQIFVQEKHCIAKKKPFGVRYNTEDSVFFSRGNPYQRKPIPPHQIQIPHSHQETISHAGSDPLPRKSSRARRGKKKKQKDGDPGVNKHPALPGVAQEHRRATSRARQRRGANDSGLSPSAAAISVRRAPLCHRAAAFGSMTRAAAGPISQARLQRYDMYIPLMPLCADVESRGRRCSTPRASSAALTWGSCGLC